MFGRMADAEEYFGKAIRINPLSRESYVKLAYVKNTLGKVCQCRSDGWCNAFGYSS